MNHSVDAPPEPQSIDVDTPAGRVTLQLLSDRAVFLPDSGTLLIADAHFGKAATFRASAVAIPRGTTTHDVRRLKKLARETRARRIIFLGDLLHAREGRANETLDAFTAWRSSLPDVEMLLVRGNHDRRAGDPPRAWHIECVDDPLVERGLVFRHLPEAHPDGFVLSGHIHPCVKVAGRGRQREKLACYFFSDTVAVLPAFGSFTGCARVIPGKTDRVFAIVEGEVLALGDARSEL